MLARNLLVLAVFWASSAGAEDVTFGTLPEGATSTNVVSDVGAEICRDHLFDASRATKPLPAGYRLTLVEEYAKQDPATAELLKANPGIAGYAVGSLCFVSAGSFVADGVRVNGKEPTPMAFWWSLATGPRDARMQGKTEWVQLASWYSKDIANRALVVATDPMAQFADLQMELLEPNAWRMRLALPDEVIEAEVRGNGERKKRKGAGPGFMSVPFAGKGAGQFWVITYYGHFHQAAQGQWTAKGSGVFADALQIPGESAVYGTVFQDGWSALSGVYGPVK